ncbi:MAG: hypothetical protein JOZ98_01400 [Solirubrobacterales bacterium]|nr:hypothetical protein [Solirubrobacterales bacterium]
MFVAADVNRSSTGRRLGIGMRGHGVLSHSVTVDIYVTTRCCGVFRLDRTGNRGLGMADRCLGIPEAIPSGLAAIASGQPLYAEDLLGTSLGERLRRNTPTGMIKVPLLIAHGLYAPLVIASGQDQLVKQRSDAGQNLEYRTYKGADHLSIMAPGSPVVADLLSWTEARLDGEPQGAGCRRISA